MDLLEKYKAFIKKEDLFHPNDKLLLAVSGGVDSVVLCDLCKKAGYDFMMAHCNFQLRGADSDRDEAFVKELAEKYGAELFVKRFDTNAISKKVKRSIEETARDLRYEWFFELIAPINKQQTPQQQTYILTAHHADDNIETVMMNFFRGTGIKGLHGILPKQGKLIRPLLFAKKEEIESFAKRYDLHFVTDHTNAENEYTRNYFRNEIIPLVSKHFPAAKENLLNNIQRFGEAEVLYGQAIELHKKRLLELKGNEVHIPVLKLSKTIPLSTIVYEIIKDHGFTAHQVDEVIGLLKSDTGKYIQSPSHRIIKNRNWLIISPNRTAEAQNILILEGDTDLQFAAGSLQIKKLQLNNQTPNTQHPTPNTKQTTNHIALLDASHIKFPLLLRPYKKGDYFYPLGMNKKKKLSRFFIDLKLSLPQKENVWVIESDKKIIWVVGMRIDDRVKITDKTKSVLQLTFL